MLFLFKKFCHNHNKLIFWLVFFTYHNKIMSALWQILSIKLNNYWKHQKYRSLLSDLKISYSSWNLNVLGKNLRVRLWWHTIVKVKMLGRMLSNSPSIFHYFISCYQFVTKTYFIIKNFHWYFLLRIKLLCCNTDFKVDSWNYKF